MRKKYEEPVVEIIHLEKNDIIITSGCTGTDETTEMLIPGQ